MIRFIRSGFQTEGAMTTSIGSALVLATVMIAAAPGGSACAVAADMKARSAVGMDVSARRYDGHNRHDRHYAYRPYYPYRYGHPYYYSPGPFFPFPWFPDAPLVWWR